MSSDDDDSFDPERFAQHYEGAFPQAAAGPGIGDEGSMARRMMQSTAARWAAVAVFVFVVALIIGLTAPGSRKWWALFPVACLLVAYALRATDPLGLYRNRDVLELQESTEAAKGATQDEELDRQLGDTLDMLKLFEDDEDDPTDPRDDMKLFRDNTLPEI